MAWQVAWFGLAPLNGQITGFAKVNLAAFALLTFPTVADLIRGD
jgi:hypothetical protein